MRLTIKPLTAPMASFNIAQKFGAVSKGSPIGTRNLMNCLGVVIYNRVGAIGVIAHIEAQSGDALYDKVANEVVGKLLATLNAAGGGTGSLCLVLLGNAGAHKVVIDRNPFGVRLAPPDFADLRDQRYGAFILDPAHEVLYVDTLGTNVTDAAKGKDVTMFAVQP